MRFYPVRPCRRHTVNVLVIESDGMWRLLVTRILEEAGCKIETACTRAKALEKCQSNCFDAILLALLLPDGSGWDVLRGIRALHPSSRTPVIVVSMLDKSDTEIEGPVEGLLTKPVGANELLDAMKRAGVPIRPVKVAG